ncbi:hypothetical protein Plhal304r1_c031g0099471 [Plasmopara halstedii]
MMSRLPFLCAVIPLEIGSVANFLTIASDIPNQNEVVDWDDTKSVERNLVTVDNEMRMPVNALTLTENLETVAELVATSLAQNSENNAKNVAIIMNHWMVKGEHPDKIYGDMGNIDLPTFIAWIHYIDVYLSTHVKKSMNPILSLHQYLSRHSDVVITAIATNGLETSHSNFYRQLLSYLTCYWFNSFKTTDEVDMLLKLVKGEHLNVSSMKAEYKQYYESMSHPEILGKSKVSNTATAGFKGKNRLEHNENLYKDFLAFRDFVHTYNEENPATTVGLLPALIARFGEKSAASVISAAKTDSNTAEEANELETKQIERWVAMKDPAAVLELIDFGDQSLRSIRTLFKVFDQFLKKNETPPFDLMATLTKYSTEKRLVQIVMKEENDADVERLKTLLFLDWFNGMKSDEDVKNLLHLKGLDTKKIDSCYDSFKEFCKNMTKVIKSTLAENVPTPAGNTIDHESNYDSLMRTAYETSLANYNKKIQTCS